MDVYGGIEAREFALVGFEVAVVVVADVDCAGAVAGELVGGGAADAEGGVCACWFLYVSFLLFSSLAFMVLLLVVENP